MEFVKKNSSNFSRCPFVENFPVKILHHMVIGFQQLIENASHIYTFIQGCQPQDFKNLKIYNEPFKIVLLSVNFCEIKKLANS